MPGRQVNLTYQGETMNLKDWAEKLGMHPSTISRRYREGLPVRLILCKRKLRKAELARVKNGAGQKAKRPGSAPNGKTVRAVLALLNSDMDIEDRVSLACLALEKIC